EVDRIAALIGPLLDPDDEAVRVTYAEELRGVIAGRRAAIEAALVDGPPAWTAGLRKLACRPPVGPISGTFSGTWGTLANPVFQAGAGTVMRGATAEEFTRTGVRVGPDAVGRDRLQIYGDTVDKRRLALTIDFPDPRWFEPFLVVGAHQLTTPPARMTMVESDLTTSPATILGRFEIGEGTWTFDTIDTTDGGAVSGSFAGTVYVIPP